MKKVVITLGLGLMFSTVSMAQFSWQKRTTTRPKTTHETPITSKIAFDDEDEVKEKVKEYKMQRELQAKGVATPVEYEAPAEPEVKEKKPVTIFRETLIGQTTNSQPPAVVVPEGYTGYLVEVLKSKEQLPPDHAVYFAHGYVIEEEIKGEGFSYLIGDFGNEIDAQDFVDRQLLGRYKNPEVIQYIKGKRIPR